jgi:hypothetical protein
VVPVDKPVYLRDGETARFEVPLVMHHYKICGSGFCSFSAVELSEGDAFTLEMKLLPGGVIDGTALPYQWAMPSNECPAR